MQLDSVEKSKSLQLVEEFLQNNPSMEPIEIILHDVNGVGRGKLIRAHELLPLFQVGRSVPASMLVLDVGGDDVAETGLVWETGDCDKTCWPVPSSLGLLHTQSGPKGQVLLSMYEEDGSACAADPRHALLKWVNAARAKGLQPIGAFELEFFLIDADSDLDSAPLPARQLKSRRRPSLNGTLSVDELDEMTEFFKRVYAGAADMNLNIESLISEFAPGQYELTLRHRELDRAADDIVLLKRLLRNTAGEFGMIACFMAKPFMAHAGSGMHLHISLNDDNGSNIFADSPDGELSQELLHAIGGVTATMADSMAIFAPYTNSWRRFTPGSYAPTQASWGINNRTVAIRVPRGSAAGRHFEHRMSGVDANPYLVAAVTLAATLKGLEARTSPPSATTGNGYALPLADAAFRLPRNQIEALDLFEASPFMRDVFGSSLHRAYTAVKRAEFFKSTYDVPPAEYRRYLRTV